MAASPTLLFIYGTLHPDRAPRAIAMTARRLTLVGKAAVRGRLLDLGEYPGLLLEDTGLHEVPGAVFVVPDEATLAELDVYEDFRPGDPETSLFLRVETQVMMDDGSQLACWVYVYNQL